MVLLFVVLPLVQVTIAGIDNADTKDTDPYVANSRKVWKGRAMVVIKSNHQGGEIKLSVSSNGLEGKSAIIKSTHKN